MEVGRARRLRLRGGVLVMGLEARDKAADFQARRILLQALRAGIRSTDLLGQLATGEFAALLVRANEAGIAAAEKRLRDHIDRLAREKRLPRVALGTAPYPQAEGETPGMLLDRARGAAKKTGESRFFG
jgi:GGDEF domain-containing protein